MAITTHIFKTFPEFSKLKLKDKERYDALIASFPPYSSYSFTELFAWWNILDSCSLSQLNDNLVISYWIPGDENATGLSLIGTRRIDESIATIFDYQKSRGEKPRLTHIPEFVVSSLRYPELLRIDSERDEDECILAIQKLSSLESLPKPRQWKIKRFLANIDENRITVKSLDLSKETGRELLLSKTEEWAERGGFNNINDYDYQGSRILIKNAVDLDVANVCVFVDGALHSFLLYQLPANPQYGIINTGRFSYDIPYLFDYCVYRYARWFESTGIKFLNVDADLGIPLLRATKLALGPANFLRKYILTPLPEISTPALRR